MLDEPDLEKLLPVAESVHDGWYAEGRIDWQDFLDRLESQTNMDLGEDMNSPLIRKIKNHVRNYRKTE